MKILDGAPPNWRPLSDSGSAVTIGVFDGVHLGHQKVLRSLVEDANRSGGLDVVALTFDIHPLELLAPERAPAMLTTLEQRVELLGEYGADAVGVLPFGEVRDMTPQAFIHDVLWSSLASRLVAVGTDFRFGRDRAGDVARLEAGGAELGFVVDDIGLLDEDDVPISSTRIRKALERGDVAEASSKLGRPYELRGSVVDGDKRGRELGFPTANLLHSARVQLPADGVYAGWGVLADGSTRPTAINVGIRPTFIPGDRIVEAYLLDFDQDLYGTDLSIRFVKRLRDELRFDTVGSLVAQIEKDVAEVRNLILG